MRNSLLGAAPKLWASTLDEQKLERLDRFLVEGDYAELWLLRPRNIAWVTSGADAVVDRASDTGAVALGYDGKAMHAVAADNEADRMREEELPTDVSVTKFPWYDVSLVQAVARESASGAGADVASVPYLDVAVYFVRQATE